MSHLVDASLWLQLCKKTIHELYILKSVPKSAEFAFHGQECWQFQAYPTSSTYYTKYMCDFNKKFNCLFGNGIEHWLTSPRSEIKHCIASKKWVATIRANKQSWHIFHTPSNHYTFNILPDEYLVFQRCQTGSINVILDAVKTTLSFHKPPTTILLDVINQLYVVRPISFFLDMVLKAIWLGFDWRTIYSLSVADSPYKTQARQIFFIA